MPIKQGISALLATAVLLAGAAPVAFAQNALQNATPDPLPPMPLSAIDWLSPRRLPGVTGPVLIEPDHTPGAFSPAVEVMPLPRNQPSVGLVPPNITGLSADLWVGSDPLTLVELIKSAPVGQSPAMQRLLYSILISDSYAPQSTEGDQLTLARIDRLMELGAADPAAAMAEMDAPDLTPDLFARWLDSSLVLETEQSPCRVLSERPALSHDVMVQSYCSARNGDWTKALLVAETAGVLGVLDAQDSALLLRFLTPDWDDSTSTPQPPTTPTPVEFRLHEAIGDPLITSTLPRLFANADLRDIAGWKSQLEAAERLAQSGALNPNQLLGIYTAYSPSASGGIWERARAIQSFESALAQSDPEVFTSALDDAWTHMQHVELEVPFALVFARRLANYPNVPSSAAERVWRIRLLDSGFRNVALAAPNESAETLFLQAVALGYAPMRPPRDAQAEAILRGLRLTTQAPADIQALIDNGQRGEALLQAIALYDSGAKGNLGDLADALAIIRSAGLRDVAIRAALELRILDRRG